MSGHLFDRTGNYSATFLTMAAAVVLALVVFFPVRVASRADGTGAS